MPREVRIGRGQYVDSLIIHPQTIDRRQELVADGAVDGPVAIEPFIVFKNLFDINSSLGREAAQTLEVPERLAQPIRMIDAHAVNLPLGNHLLDACMRGGGNNGQFGADADERVNVEEAAVVGPFPGQLPAVKDIELPVPTRGEHRSITPYGIG